MEDDNFECEVAPFFPSSRVAPVSNFCHGNEISNFTHHSFISSLEELWFTRFHVWTGCWCSRQGWSKKMLIFFHKKKCSSCHALARCTILSETGKLVSEISQDDIQVYLSIGQLENKSGTLKRSCVVL